MNALKVEGEKGRAFEINLRNTLQKRYEISARTVARVLSEHGITLKKVEKVKDRGIAVLAVFSKLPSKGFGTPEISSIFITTCHRISSQRFQHRHPTFNTF